MSEVNVETLVLGDLDTNCYVVSCKATGAALIIDPADNGEYITSVILEKQLLPQAIILTHGHFDHVLGLLEVKLNFQTPVLMHEADAFLLEKARDSAKYWLKREVDPVPPADVFIKDAEMITFGEAWLRVLETPGHTPGSVTLYNDEVMFTGDTLFKEGVGSTNHSYSSSKQLWKSVEKINDLRQKKAHAAYPGHGSML